MKKNLVAGIAVVIVLAAIAYFFGPRYFTVRIPDDATQGGTKADSHADLIKVTNVVASEKLISPLTIEGMARGTWYFEASFPVVLKDANGTVLFQGPAQATGDWMTTDFVPFKVTVTFPKPGTPTGVLILKKDNPSGDPAKEDSISIPVTF